MADVGEVGVEDFFAIVVSGFGIPYKPLLGLIKVDFSKRFTRPLATRKERSP